jgi:hypothetical protein
MKQLINTRDKSVFNLFTIFNIIGIQAQMPFFGYRPPVIEKCHKNQAEYLDKNKQLYLSNMVYFVLMILYYGYR